MKNMGTKWWLCYCSFLVVFMLQGPQLRCHGCWEGERVALLHLQPSFQGVQWANYNGSDCCGWDEVRCDDSTGRVTQLLLSYSTQPVGSIHDRYYLNASLFLPFQHLNLLDLGNNSIAGCVKDGGFERLSSLRKLEHLDLRNNYLHNTVMTSLQHLSSLKYLSLYNNSLSGSLPLHEVNGLNSLTELDLSLNSIESFQTSGVEILNLTNLQRLSLPNNLFNNDVLSCLRDLSTLRTLDLSGNRLEGSLRVKEFDGLNNLEDLALGYNRIANLIPSRGTKALEKLEALDLSNVSTRSNNLLQTASSFPSLKTLYLSGNTFHESETGKEMNGLTKLEELYMDVSSISASFFQVVGALTSHQVLQLRNCSITGHQQLEGLCRLTKLRKLVMIQNELHGTIPSCFSNFSSLEVLDISDNQLSGDVALSPLGALSSIQELYISDNQFRVPISLAPFLNLSNLRYFFASGNEIYPDESDSAPAFQLNILYLTGGGSARAFPKFLYHQYDLSLVDLSRIDFGGAHFPHWLLENNTNLWELYITEASLSGPLTFPSHSYENMTKWSYLQRLDINSNYLSGNFPLWISNLRGLKHIKMAGNLLQGPLPSQLFDLPSLQFLDLSTNAISGAIPSSFNLPEIVHIHLFRNRLEGTLPGSLCNASRLVTLDLSDNRFTGIIPECIGGLQRLSYLLLKNNSFWGRIPHGICLLTKLSVMDLSRNHLIGSVPHCLNITTFDNAQRYDEALAALYSNEQVWFQTKSRYYAYKWRSLALMAGIDLSCNELTGRIPDEIGSLDKIHVLNLSHNNLVGGIPVTMSNLKQIESLDLSFNHLRGGIPPQFVGLTSLADFSVSFNNLSGPTPKRANQFATFEESSYRGNPFLCGEPLPRSCAADGPPNSNQKAPTDEEEDVAFMDIYIFYISFIASYVTSFSAVLLVLWINPHWNYKLEMIITSCYYYVVDLFYSCKRYLSRCF